MPWLGGYRGLECQACGCDWRLHGWCALAANWPRRRPERIRRLLLLGAGGGLTGASPEAIDPRCSTNMACGFLSRPAVRRGPPVARLSATPETQCGAGRSRGRLAASTHARLGDSLPTLLPAAVVFCRFAAARLPERSRCRCFWGTNDSDSATAPLKRQSMAPAGARRDGARRNCVHLPIWIKPNQVARLLVNAEACHCRREAGTLLSGSHQRPANVGL